MKVFSEKAAPRGAVFWLVAAAVAAASCSFMAASPAAAASWWEELTTGGADYGNHREADHVERKPEALDDLRVDSTPWCSDEMRNAYGGAIERFERIVAAGGWPLIPGGRMMRPGDDDERIPILRKRLRISGDLAAQGQYYDSQSYDTELEAGVKRFQLRHGIRPSGRIEQSMYAVLNVTAPERLEQLKLNFERLRALA